MSTITTEMNADLTTALIKKGWNPGKVAVWGRRVSGDAHGVTLERDGKTREYFGPFVSITGGDQSAIVRWG